MGDRGEGGVAPLFLKYRKENRSKNTNRKMKIY